MTETEDFDRFLRAAADMPGSVFDQDALRGGAVILPIIGILYMYGVLYILNRRYFYPAIEHLIGLLDEVWAPTIYCTLNSAIYLFVMIYSVVLAKDNFGIATILGSDALNLLLIMAVVQLRVKTFTEIDPWIFIKESTFYFANLIIAGIFFSFKELKWWMALLWLGYFCIYIMYFQKKNEQLRDKLALLLGLKDEDDVFNAEPNYAMVRRRHSLTEIIELNIFDLDDPEMQRKIRRNEGALKIQLRDLSKFPVYSRFQSAVYKVIFALQKKNEYEKEQRSKIFKEKVEKLTSNSPQKKLTRQLEADQRDDQIIEKKDEEENLISKDKNPLSSEVPDAVPQNDDVLNKVEKEEHEGHRGDELIMPSQTNLENINDNEPNDLEFPKELHRKIGWVITFPVRLMFYFMLSRLKKQITLKSAGYSVFIVLCLQAGITFLIVWWTTITTTALEIQPEVSGISFTSVGVSISFIIYNLRLQTSQHNANFLTTFELMGIYKFGLAAPVGWLAYFLFAGVSSTDQITKGFQISTFIYLAMFVSSIGVIGSLKVRIHKKMMIPYAVGYAVFLITAIVLCSSLTEPS